MHDTERFYDVTFSKEKLRKEDQELMRQAAAKQMEEVLRDYDELLKELGRIRANDLFDRSRTIRKMTE